VATDLAIDGEGFFILSNPATSSIVFTRTGDFRLNQNGDLVNGQGLIVQGFDPNKSSINALPFAENINLGGQAFSPKQTAKASITANLDSAVAAPGVTFNAAQASTTSNFATALTFYDSLGKSHTTEIYFQKQTTPANTWNWFTVADAQELTGAGIPASGPVTLARGDITFTTAGALSTTRTLDRINYATGALVALGSAEQGANVLFDYAGGTTTGQSVSFDFGEPLQIYNSATSTFSANPKAINGLEGTTQFSAASAALFQSQDGFSSGVLENFNVDRDGFVEGFFSNGQSRKLFQLALAKFPNPGGLTALGDLVYNQSGSSGEPVVAAPGTTGLGGISANSLETSNVDLATQFVELIRAQQAFQANARVITTSDELLTEAVNLIR
jgi:flagellar hook protein FlgE